MRHDAETARTHPGGTREDGPFWTGSPEALAARLGCGLDGLSAAQAARRLAEDGPNGDRPARADGVLRAVLRRLLEPFSLILLAAGLVSIATGDWGGGVIIIAILTLSIGLDTLQEGHAVRAAEALRRSVALTAEVKRDGRFRTVPVEEVVRGDLIRVRAGDIVPADALVLASAAFSAVEAALTGEPYPVEKRPGPVAATAPAEAANALFRGAVAQSGEALALVAATGRATMFGAAAASLAESAAPSPFQRDLREFGLVVARLTLVLVVAVLAVRVALGRPVLDSLLFAVALAVGLTPELLPMITTVTLARGALRMARRKVIVKRLAGIHDLGAMTVLCTDKTGTLTSAEIVLARSFGPDGRDDPRPARLGAVAAALGGERGALDAALRRHGAAGPDGAARADGAAAEGWRLLALRPFEAGRRSGAVLAEGPEGPRLIVKGAPEAVLALCTERRDGAGTAPLGDPDRAACLARLRALAEEGYRAIAVASREAAGPRDAGEAGLVLDGFCAFADPPKPDAAAAVAELARAGVRVKILSGDDPVVVRRLAGHVGLPAPSVLSGTEVAALGDEALAVQVRRVDAFGRLAPDQKARIVKALQAGGEVVGFLGDGINDAPGLRQADIGLSVEGATGVAQAAADMILLAPDLAVVAAGVAEGRRTFANILKYIRMGASSNFGNMLSMAAASAALPFLPMLPTQILLNNLLYDLSEIGIPFDHVRPEAVARPQTWEMAGLLRFAAVMGPLSSLFDLLTFGVLLLGFGAAPDVFRTAWFLESMATQILVIVVIRTAGRPWRDRPGSVLAVTSLAALAVALLLPFTPAGPWFGFAPPPPALLAAIAAITAAYLAAAEAVKPWATGARRPAGFLPSRRRGRGHAG
ncbi:magnesium-translocating P-type ATPase [Methylobacterium sp. 4-46]|uniref:magnesium-translocating P-type ATPase n=1 Tax=unclassified Methylobacterium TaxID=2615210 RepID=UPI000165CD31|nr:MULTISPECIES: magnesium-translocating P-type ATPase [Methylobacterium]ACA20372.1 magnesium-translocating P-type ATPase [Methylobacterium sp. 4-46]WFT79541.1 magnesium-translocating P-type ATPase [Methylobacterium nodulans]